MMDFEPTSEIVTKKPGKHLKFVNIFLSCFFDKERV